MSNPAQEALDKHPRALVERLAYIDFRLYFLGELKRSELMDRFGTGPAGATRDLAVYRDLRPENLRQNPATKIWELADGFSPLFEHPAEQTLTALSRGFGAGLADGTAALVPCEFPTMLSGIDAEVLAPITRAINQHRAVRLSYFSVSSGKSTREIVPLALVDVGPRWHTRAFDRKSGEFRDFVFTRMSNLNVLSDEVGVDEHSSKDDEWNRMVELPLVVHPSHPQPDAIERDYRMKDGLIRVKSRAAHAGYMLQEWRVDCSSDHQLNPLQYPLWLRDRLVLYGVSNADLAPGYV